MRKKTLLIVESPTKAKTIHKYLGTGYIVLSSMGHIIDLPKSRLAVDVDNNFEPDYITIRGRGKVIEQIKKAAAKSSKVLLASDNDREGEAIAWNIHHVLTTQFPDLKISRIVFNEITKKAICESIKNPVELNLNKVNAQKARRILDRIVGYYLSPLLWEKVKKGLSAGRVQSSALKLVCNREEEINKFKPEEYWNLEGMFKYKQRILKAMLHEYKNKKVKIVNEKQSISTKDDLSPQNFSVAKIVNKHIHKSPYAPFTTSRLQQDAATRLSYSADKTMRIAQSLYEGVDLKKETVGLISYIRTDSVRISKDAIENVRNYIVQEYGKEYLSSSPILYANRKNVQDAHECIRPTLVSQTPDSLAAFLSKEQLALYKLIWKRFVGCQMSKAKYEQYQVNIVGGNGLFRISTSKIVFDGFYKVYGLPSDEDKKELGLSKLKEGTILKLTDLEATQHFTIPPARYSEASMVKQLEESAIGRPSTYAPTLQTLVKRFYLKREKSQLYATELGSLINELISEFFPNITDAKFTARMEESLDKIEESQIDWVELLRKFFDDFRPQVDIAKSKMKNMKGFLDEKVDDICEKCGANMVKRLGAYGYFLACPEFPKCRNSKPIPIADCVAQGCKGKLVAKRAKKRLFYGCSLYPECRFVSWESVSDTNCAQCGKILFNKSARKETKVLSCKNENCSEFKAVLSQKK